MILITEFMDEAAVNLLKKKYDVYYDSSLFEDPNSLIKKPVPELSFAWFFLGLFSLFFFPAISR